VWPSRAALINALAPLSDALKIRFNSSGFSALNKSRSCWAPESLVRTSLKTSNLNGEVLYKFYKKEPWLVSVRRTHHRGAEIGRRSLKLAYKIYYPY
jgi:hypothetical protein